MTLEKIHAVYNDATEMIRDEFNPDILLLEKQIESLNKQLESYKAEKENEINNANIGYYSNILSYGRQCFLEAYPGADVENLWPYQLGRYVDIAATEYGCWNKAREENKIAMLSTNKTDELAKIEKKDESVLTRFSGNQRDLEEEFQIAHRAVTRWLFRPTKAEQYAEKLAGAEMMRHFFTRQALESFYKNDMGFFSNDNPEFRDIRVEQAMNWLHGFEFFKAKNAPTL